MLSPLKVNRTRTRAGVTLVELLVVVTIAVLLVATSVPLMKPAMQEGKLREASRQLNTYIQVARTRAIDKGRPAGIMIERSAPGSNTAFQVFIAETPPPYVGDTLSSLATDFTASGSGSSYRIVNIAGSQSLPAIVQAGDLIKFDFKGHYYPITQVAPLSVSSTTWVEVDVSKHSLPWFPSTGVRYQVLRRPVKSSATPLQFAGNICIDLEYSGLGSTTTYDASGIEQTGREFRASTATDDNHIVIAFGASGNVDHVTVGTVTRSVQDAIHLLIARSDRVGEPADNKPATPNPIPITAGHSLTHTYSMNIADPSSLWVSISPSNGSATSAENAWQLAPSTAAAGFSESLELAREYAQAGLPIGGP